MFEQDKTLFSFRGLGGLKIEIGFSILLLAVLYASLAQGLNPQGLTMFAIVVASALLAAFVQAAFAVLQGVRIDRICLGGAGVELLRQDDRPAPDELLIGMALPVTHFALFGFFGLVANVAANQVAAVNLAGGATETAIVWQNLVALTWQIATVNFFLGLLHLMPAYPLVGGALWHRTLRSVLPAGPANVVMGFTGLMMFMFWIPMGLALLSVGLGVFLFAPAWHRHMALMNNQTRA